MTTTMERGEFLSLGMKGGLALVAGGAVLGAAAAPALGQASGDVAIAKLAATAELLAVDVYSRAIKTGFFTGDVLAYMEAARQNEQDHYDALAEALGAQAPKGLTFTYPAGTFKDTGHKGEAALHAEGEELASLHRRRHPRTPPGGWLSGVAYGGGSAADHGSDASQTSGGSRRPMGDPGPPRPRNPHGLQPISEEP